MTPGLTMNRLEAVPEEHRTAERRGAEHDADGKATGAGRGDVYVDRQRCCERHQPYLDCFCNEPLQIRTSIIRPYEKVIWRGRHKQSERDHQQRERDQLEALR